MTVHRITEETVLEAPETQLLLPKRFVGHIGGGVTVPIVRNLEIFQCTNTAPVSVTHFKDGQIGQTIRLLGDGFTTIVHGATVKTNTAANKLLLVNKVYTFTLYRIPDTDVGVRTWVENE